MSDRPAPLPPHARRCSFCNKARAELRALVAGPDASVCDECVAVAIQILLDGTAERVPHDTACSFCHRTRAQVRVMIPGPGDAICDACVQLSANVLLDGGHLDAALADALAEAGFIGAAPALPTARVRVTWWKRWLGRGW